MNILKLAAEHPWAIQTSVLEQAISGATKGITPEAAVKRPMQRAGSVAVIPLQGVLRQKGSTFMDELFGDGGGSTDRFAANINKLAADASVGTIVIDCHSPGGEVFGTQEAADAVFAARQKKPVLAVVNSLSASAAYWIASQATEIIGSPSSLTGSIGVFAMHEDISQMAENAGVKVTFISAGKFKTEGNQFQPLTEDAKAAIQKTIDQHYSAFVGAVARGRKASQTSVRDGMGQGRVLTAKDALAAGMIDRVGTMQDLMGSLSIDPSGMMAIKEWAIDAVVKPPSDAEPIEHPGGCGCDGCESIREQIDETMPQQDAAAQQAIERERWEYVKLGA